MAKIEPDRVCAGCARERCQCETEIRDDAGYLVRVAQRLSRRAGASQRSRIVALRRAMGDVERLVRDLEIEERIEKKAVSG